MPTASPTPCTEPGCSALTQGGKCEQHRRESRKAYDRATGSRHQRGYGNDWYAFVANYRTCKDLDPLTPGYAAEWRRRNCCVVCAEQGIRTVHKLEYDHIVPLKHGGARLDPANVQPLCDRHHRLKTQAEMNGRFEVGQSIGERVLLCGPPGSGKTTLALASISAGQVIVDYDLIVAAISGQPMHVRPEWVHWCAMDAIEALYEWLVSHPSLGAYIVCGYTDPVKAEALAGRLGARIRVLDTPIATCEERVAQRMDAARFLGAIREWEPGWGGR